MTTQYIAVISDQHITEQGTHLYGLETNACSQRLFTELAQATLPKLVVGLGDLADTTCNPRRDEATGSIDSYRNAQELATPLSKPLLTIPGNHDDPDLLNSFFPSRWDSSSKGISVCKFNHAHLIGMDVRTGPEATGRIAPETLEQLDRVLTEVDKAVIFTHFPLATLDNPRINETLSVLNRDELLPIIRSHPKKILGFVGGHLHLRYSTQIEGVLAEGAPSTSFMFRAEPGSREPITVSDEACGYLLLGVNPEQELIVRHRYLSGASPYRAE